MKSYVEFNRIKFPMELYERLMNIFKESLSHSSLACENAFLELEEKERELLQLYQEGNESILSSLPPETVDEIMFKMKFFLVYEAATKAVISSEFRRVNIEDPESKKRILEVFDEHLKEYENLLREVIIFDEDHNMKDRESFRATMNLFRAYSERKVFYERAHSMKKDHISAFEYALSLPHIGAREIKEINSLVNQSQVDKEDGFKIVDNIIVGANCETANKGEVGTRIAELLYGYQHNYQIGDIIEVKHNSTREEKNLWLYQIMLREARFHIDFIRIHPFIDGNGRTGRIILNRNLIMLGVAPILITETMFEDYKRFIENRDYDGFAKSLMILSSQQQSLWVSSLREHLNMQADSIEPVSLVPTPR